MWCNLHIYVNITTKLRKLRMVNGMPHARPELHNLRQARFRRLRSSTKLYAATQIVWQYGYKSFSRMGNVAETRVINICLWRMHLHLPPFTNGCACCNNTSRIAHLHWHVPRASRIAQLLASSTQALTQFHQIFWCYAIFGGNLDTPGFRIFQKLQKMCKT